MTENINWFYRQDKSIFSFPSCWGLVMYPLIRACWYVQYPQLPFFSASSPSCHLILHSTLPNVPVCLLPCMCWYGYPFASFPSPYAILPACHLCWSPRSLFITISWQEGVCYISYGRLGLEGAGVLKNLVKMNSEDAWGLQLMPIFINNQSFLFETIINVLCGWKKLVNITHTVVMF